MTTSALIRQAREDYGSLITRITTWPAGLGIDVHLVGGDRIQYFPGGTKHLVDQPSARIKAGRWLAAARGAARRFLG